LQGADHGVFIAQGAQPPGAVGILRRFYRDKNEIDGRVMTAGSVNTGPGTTVSPSSWRRRNSGCAVRPHSSGVRPRHAAPRQWWSQSHRDQSAQSLDCQTWLTPLFAKPANSYTTLKSERHVVVYTQHTTDNGVRHAFTRF
jgi:hypothetical protein